MKETFGQAIPRSLALFERAARVIPGGIYGHTSPAGTLPGVFPYFAERAKGARYRDYDGREFLDFLCGYGTHILGYGDAEVEAAAEAQRKRGNALNHPTERAVELAEALVERIDFADWAVFGKNGSDMTTWAVQVAREHTGRPKVFLAEGAYHGVDSWCSPGAGGLIPEDRAQVHTFTWNRPDTLEAGLKAHAGAVAAVILTPFHHPSFHPSVLPDPGFLEGVQRLCREAGALLILDDIRAGFRLHGGGSHRYFGFEPDLACHCKCLANGYPLSATVGKASLKKAASRVFLTGSYWNDAVSMAASLTCLHAIDERVVPEKLARLGNRLMDGLERSGADHGFRVVRSGPPAMPYLSFDPDPDLFRMQRFCELMVERGILLHPHHNWFLCAAHTEEDIASALDRSEEVFALMKMET